MHLHTLKLFAGNLNKRPVYGQNSELTPAEREVMQGLAQGKKYQKIADERGTTYNTTKK